MGSVLFRVLTSLVALLFVAPAQAQNLDATAIYLGSAPCKISTGSSAPNSSVVGSPCDTYHRTGTGEIYTKATGSGTNTGWQLIGLPSGSADNTLLAGSTAGSPTWSATPQITSLVVSGANGLRATTGYTGNIGEFTKKFLTVHAAELWVQTLIAADTMATIGGRVVVAPTTTLTSDLASGGTSIAVKHNNLANGDRLLMEANGQVEFLAVTSGSSGSGPYTYSVTRNLDGSGANNWTAGDAVMNTGTTGDGFLDLYSVRGVIAGSTAGPTIVCNVRTGTTYNNLDPRCAMGNLNGIYGYVTDTYGFAAGDNAAAWIKVDPTNGLRIGHGATSSVQITAAGAASFAGSVTASAGYIGGWDIESTSLRSTNVGMYSDGTIGTTATDFNGTSSVITGAFSASTPAALTMGVWANADNTTASVVAAVGRNGYGGWTIYQSGGNWSASFPGVGAFGSAAVTTGTWQHLVLRRTGGTWTLFVNGVSAGTSTSTPGDPATDSYKTIGAIRNVGNTAYELFFNGKAAHFFYAAEALTDAQIVNMYNGGPGGAGYAPHLFATGYAGQSPLFQYYPLNDDNPLSIWSLGTGTLTATSTASIAGPSVAMEAARVQAGTTTNLTGLTGTYSSSDVGLFVGSSWATRFTAPFRVTAAGALTATSATITGAITATSGNITAALQADSITSAMIQAGTIAASDIAAGTITATQIASGTITATQIASGTITATQIAASTITGTQIAASTITAAKLSVSTLSSITADIGTITAGTINGITITAGGGNVTLDSDGLEFAASADSFSNGVNWANGAYMRAFSTELVIIGPTSGTILMQTPKMTTLGNPSNQHVCANTLGLLVLC